MNWSYVAEKNAKEYPEKEAIIFGDRRITYSELNKRVNALAKGLLDLGLGKGDVVALVLYNCPEFVEVTFAVNKIGAIWLPLNYRLAGEEVAYILNHGEARILISEMDFYENLSSIKDKLPRIKEYVAVGESIPPGWKRYDDIVEKNLGSEVPDVEVELDDLQRLIYTSGTTAHPKGVMITYGNFHWKDLSHAAEWSITADDKIVMPSPLYHVAYDMGPTTVLLMGGSVVLLRRFDTIEVLEAIDREKPTMACFVPIMLSMLFEEPTFDNYDVSSLRLIVDGGEKTPVHVLEKLREKFLGTWYARGYGLTETVSGDVTLRKDTPIDKMVSDGRLMPGLRLRIVDGNGKDVPSGTVGEIILKGPKVFKGYWKNEEATAEAIKDGWFHTGDLGYLDEEGYLYIEGRKKDLIISGGENVAPVEVESVISELSQVHEVAVVGMPHPKWVEVPKAFVVLKEGEKLTEQDIIEHCKKKLARFKAPKEVAFLSALPRNPMGKLLKRELKQMG